MSLLVKSLRKKSIAATLLRGTTTLQDLAGNTRSHDVTPDAFCISNLALVVGVTQYATINRDFEERCRHRCPKQRVKATCALLVACTGKEERNVSQGWLGNGVRAHRLTRRFSRLFAVLISAVVLLSAGGASIEAHGAASSAGKATCGGTVTVPLPMHAPSRKLQALRYNFKTSTITLTQMASAQLPPFTGIVCMESPPPVPGEVAYWSPNGNWIALSLSETAGTAEVGSVSPLRLHSVQLGVGMRVVGLTDSYLIGSSWRTGRVALYPIEPSGVVGKPIVWRAARDLWQSWVPLAGGHPAIETGGYGRGALSLTQQNGKRFALRGGEMYLSPDGRFGAVMVRPRWPCCGGLAGFSELQPANAGSAISIWYLGGRHGPRRLAVLHLPLTKSQAKAQIVIQGVAFSLDDRYVAIQPTDLDTAGAAPTFIFTVSGRLVGRAPYGNGLAWLPRSNGLWISTPAPEGQGSDRIVDVHGQTISVWPDAVGDTVLPLSSTTTLAARPRRGVIGLIADGSFTALRGMATGVGVIWSRWSPGGKAAILEVQSTHELTLWLLQISEHPHKV